MQSLHILLICLCKIMCAAIESENKIYNESCFDCLCLNGDWICSCDGEDNKYNIVLDVFSGRINPSWEIQKGDPYYSEITVGLEGAQSTIRPNILGYRGFNITITDANQQQTYISIGVGTNKDLEIVLLYSSSSNIEPDIRQHVLDSLGPGIPHSNLNLTEKVKVKQPKKMAICIHPQYNPQKWNVLPIQTLNNCYNYATDRQTNTFAQPGRACGNIFKQFTARNVMKAAICDKLKRLPLFKPKKSEFCYIALVIWPNVDFHFYRFDGNGKWSHKPGQTKATNLDNGMNLIPDPRTANRGPYVVFAGFLGNHPGVTVK